MTLTNISLILQSLSYPELTLNTKKTIFGSKAHRRLITGLIITNDNKVSLGRNKKRQISAKIHHYLNKDLNDNEIEELKGLIAFANSVEPDFLYRLKKKYKLESLDIIMKYKGQSHRR